MGAVQRSHIKGVDERKIVRQYALGGDLGLIADGMRWERTRVFHLITRVCGSGMNRNTAAEQVRLYDAAVAVRPLRHAAVAQVSLPASPVPAVAGRQKKKAKPRKPSETIVDTTVVPAGTPLPDAEPAPPAGELKPPPSCIADIEDLLSEAEQSGIAQQMTRAAEIRSLIGVLERGMRNQRQEQQLRDEINELTRLRDSKMQALKEFTNGRVSAAASDLLSQADRVAVRQWARENSIPCSDTGRISGTVIDAWRESARDAN